MSQGGASGETRRGFSAHAGATPGRAALVLGDRTLTYGQLDSRSGWVARALRGMNIPTRSEFRKALSRVESLEHELEALKAKLKKGPAGRTARGKKAGKGS